MSLPESEGLVSCRRDRREERYGRIRTGPGPATRKGVVDSLSLLGQVLREGPVARLPGGR